MTHLKMKIFVKSFALAFALAVVQPALAKKEDENYNKALVELSKERYTSTINLLTSYLSTNEQAPLAYYYRSIAELKSGEAAMALGDIDVALQLVRKLPKDSKIKQPELLYQKADCQYVLGQTSEALVSLDEAIALSQNFTQAYVLKAKVMSEKKDFVGADSTFGKALSLDPRNYDALVLYSKNLIDAGKLSDAIEKLNQAVTINKDSKDAYLLRFQANKQLQNYEKAFDDIAFVASNEDDYSPYEKDVKDVAIKCHTYSLPYISSKINANEHSIMWLLVRAAIYKYDGKYLDAIKDYNTLDDKLGEKYAITMNEVADCYMKLGDTEKAQQLYGESMELEETAEASAGLASILKCKGELDKALVYASKAISLDPMNCEYYCTRGQIYELKSMTGDALSDYEVGIQMSNDYSPLYLRRGLLKNSKSDFSKVVKLESSPKPSDNCKPVALAQLGKVKEGRAWVERIIKEYPTSENYYVATCFYACVNDSAKAMNSLEKALEKGYRDFSQIDSDKNLDSLRKSDAFEILCNKWKKASGVTTSFSAQTGNGQPAKPTVVKEVRIVRSGNDYFIPVVCCGVSMSAVIDTSLQVSEMSKTDAEFLSKYGYGRIRNDKFVAKLKISDIEVDGIEFLLVENKDAVLRLNAVAITKFGTCSINRQNSTLKIER